MPDTSFHAEIIAEAEQSAQAQVEIIAEAASAVEAAQAHAEFIATAAAAAQAHAEFISLAAKSAAAAQTQAEAAADALRVSELRYRRLFETARDGILILDPVTGRITDANPFMAELLGYSHAEFLGKELWEIGLLRDKEASQEAFGRLEQDKYIRYENLPLENRNGERREVEFVSNLYPENGHTVIQCNIRDITDRKRVEKDLAAAAARNERIAETLQRSMLQTPPVGKFPGVVVETLYAAAMNESDMGGDFFDAFALTRGKVALVVGDVSGKGLVAAERTAEVKYALRCFIHAHQAPELALFYLNEFIYETHRLDTDNTEAFVVLAVAVVDTATGDATFSAAGAESPLILRADNTVEAVEITGMPLGIHSDSAYMARTLRLNSGDAVLMATDGITEARRGNAFLGTGGLATLAEKAGPTASLHDLIAAIYDGARDFAGGALGDDACLLLARRI